jgi:protein involved in polysaccharide export with SLBB domain
MTIAPLFAWALLMQQQVTQPVRLKTGDVVGVYVATADAPPFTRDMPILSDGAIYGVGFGKLKVAGLTVDQAQSALRVSLKRLFRPEDVFLTLLKQRVSYVYVIGTNAPGPIEINPDGVYLNQVLPPMTKDTDAQRLDVQLIRNGKVLGRGSYVRVLTGQDPLSRTKIESNDLVSVVPQASVRVWVVGPVKNPGAMVLPEGVTIYQAVAAAGGIQTYETSTKIVVRHGPDTSEFPARPDAQTAGPVLTEGDVVTVVAAVPIRVTVTGQVNKPDEFVVESGTSLLQLISKAEGVAGGASLRRVFLFRKGEATQYDFQGLTEGTSIPDPKLQEGDTVYVDENRRSFYVFGHVKKSGRYSMAENKVYHVTDALSAGEGLDEKGSMRRVYLYRAAPDGKPTITQFNLDEFLTGGKLSANPEIQPGDAILFSEPKGLTFSSLTQAFNAFFILNALRR